MTTKEIYNEVLACKARIRMLQQEIMSAKNKYIAEHKASEIIMLENRITLLDELNQRSLTERFEGDQSNIFTKLATMFARG